MTEMADLDPDRASYVRTRLAMSDTGGQKILKQEMLGAVDPTALRALGRVAAFGMRKYSRFNYLKGYPYSWSVDAKYRHFLKFQEGTDHDEESGELHILHDAWHSLAIASFQLRGLGTDDRFGRQT